MNSKEIAPNIYWVGHVDWDMRDFHGYHTPRGTSYNAYLIVDEKIALIDAVKAGYADDLLAKVSERIDPAKIDYVISNHTEPDHSGELAAVMKQAPQATLVASPKGQQGLIHYYGDHWKWQVAKTGDSLKLGQHTLHFINTPMLHWPDSMFTYLPEAKILFSMDAFGQHFATSGRFDTDVEYDVLMAEAKTYYANIIMHLGSIVRKTLQQAAALSIDMVCPSHGVIWTKHLGDILQAYQNWAEHKPTSKILIIYETMWHSTEMMAQAIAQGAAEEGINVKLLRVSTNDLTQIITEVLDAAALAVGTPTLNNYMMPSIAAFLTYIRGLKPQNKLGFAFGSYGWSGGAVAQTAEILKEIGIERTSDDITCPYRPNEQILQTCRQAGKELAQKVKQRVKENA